jgi:hypothetical protein
VDYVGGSLIGLVSVGLLHPPTTTLVICLCYGLSMNCLVDFPKVLVVYELEWNCGSHSYDYWGIYLLLWLKIWYHILAISSNYNGSISFLFIL